MGETPDIPIFLSQSQAQDEVDSGDAVIIGIHRNGRNFRWLIAEPILPSLTTQAIDSVVDSLRKVLLSAVRPMG